MMIHIFADLHLYGPKSKNFTVHDIIEFGKKYSNVFLLGDIIDFKNCLKSDLEKAKQDFKLLKKHFGDRYVMGNHEGFQGMENRFSYSYHIAEIPNYPIMLLHGHRIFWKVEKSNRWEGTDYKGISHKKYLAMSAGAAIDEMFLRNKSHLTKKQVEQVLAYGSPSIRLIIMGHKHPHKLIDELFYIKEKGFFRRIIVVPMGYTKLEVEK